MRDAADKNVHAPLWPNDALGGGFGFGRGFGQRVRHPFDEGHFRAVALAGFELDDAGVAAGTAGHGGDNGVEELLHSLDTAQARGGETAGGKGALAGKGDHFLGVAAGGLGLGKGGADAAVEDEAGDEHAEELLAVGLGTSEFFGEFAVAHGLPDLEVEN